MDRGKRRSVVVLSSSSSELEDSAEESQDDLHDAVDGETSSYSTSGDDDSDVSGVNDGEDDDIDSDYLYSDDDQAANEEEEHEETSSDDDACGGRCDGDDDSQYKFVIQLLQGGREEDLRKLTLRALRIYLRRHGLRISGSKDVCLKRIQEHWRIKDGNGDVIYPRSSFSINCKGDVCKGDVVLFIQKVYKKFDKAKRCGEVLGSRTVAGQVVKESYGAAKQQHTFTVEVLWSKGIKKLPPLFPLLVKGRNLYRMKTFRQPWKNEAERSKVLDEKHERGARARQKRQVRLLSRDLRRKTHSSNNGHLNQNPSNLTIALGSGKAGKGYQNRMETTVKHTSGFHRQGGSSLKQSTTVKAMGAKTKEGTSRVGKEAHFRDKYSTSGQFCDNSHQRKQRENRRYDDTFMGPSAFTGIPPTNPKPYGFPHQAPYLNCYDSGHLRSARSSQPFDYGRPSTLSQQRSLIRCSRRGCKGLGTEGCVMFACWSCCQRAGRRCRVHHQ